MNSFYQTFFVYNVQSFLQVCVKDNDFRYNYLANNIANA